MAALEIFSVQKIFLRNSTPKVVISNKSGTVRVEKYLEGELLRAVGTTATVKDFFWGSLKDGDVRLERKALHQVW